MQLIKWFGLLLGAAMATTIHVTPRELAEIRALAAIPPRIHAALTTFAAQVSPTGTLLITGLADVVTHIPPTPPDNTAHVGETTELARIQAVFNHAIGEMVAYEAEGGGRLFQDIVPNRGLAQTQTSLGSGVELEIHTEQAFSELRPDWLSLACLRGNPEARTYILPVGSVLANLTAEEVAMLRRPLWTFGVDMSFKVGGHEFIGGDIRGPMPILYGDAADPLWRFDQDLIRGLTPEADQLVARIVEIYYARRHAIVLEPGQIVLIDNRRAVHGRSAFTSPFDGTDRFLVRSFVVRDLSASAYARDGDSRMIMARHS